MTDYKPEHKDTPATPVVHKTKDVVTPVVVTELGVNKVPEGAMDIRDVRPGFGPTEGSPKENDPTQLANPNNPISYVTRPVNPSNPANMPAMQSEKPASEVAKMPVPPEVLAARKKAEEDELAREKKEAEAIHKAEKK